MGATDNIVTEFATYEDFLDSQITPLDLYYLEVILFYFLLYCFVLSCEYTQVELAFNSVPLINSAQY